MVKPHTQLHPIGIRTVVDGMFLHSALLEALGTQLNPKQNNAILNQHATNDANAGMAVARLQG